MISRFTGCIYSIVSKVYTSCMDRTFARRRSTALLVVFLLIIFSIFQNPDHYKTEVPRPTDVSQATGEAVAILERLEVKGRAPKTGYTRSQFGNGWITTAFGCDMRNEILQRDLVNTIINIECKVVSGTLIDPYTGKTIVFERGAGTSQLVQVDHVVALSDAWQKGAQQLDYEARVQLANDPLELLAVDGGANQQKGDGDAATWLPPNRLFRCQYVARQIAVKKKYSLWVTQAEKDAMIRVLSGCPGQRLPAGLVIDGKVSSSLP